MTVYLDTHTLIDLANGKTERIGNRAQALIQRGTLLTSPMAVFELQILHEIGRLRWTVERTMRQVVDDFGLQVSPLAFDLIVRAAFHEGWTRDPFDRLIVAHARLDKSPLATKDERMQANYAGAVW